MDSDSVHKGANTFSKVNAQGLDASGWYAESYFFTLWIQFSRATLIFYTSNFF